MYRVMVADDEPIMRKALLTLTNWQELECEVIYTAVNGREVLDHLEEMKPDILITDIKMPGANGIEIARYIWEKKLGIKVILLTAYADFSFAQAAVKYSVVDYVTKTGAFEGLIAAIEKAKESLRQEDGKNRKQDSELMRENYLKSAIDGSVYEREELEEKAEECGLWLEHFYILLLHFRLDREAGSERRNKVQKSLTNFLEMAFGEQLLQGTAVRRDMFALLLDGEAREDVEKIQEQCLQVMDMMGNFMKLHVYIGVSDRMEGAGCIGEAYEHARETLEQSFLEEESQIHYYGDVRKEGAGYLEESDQKAEELFYLIKKGEPQQALKAFEGLLDIQKSHKESAAVIKNSGILIRSRCRKILADYDKNLYDIAGFKSSISQQIYGCFHVEDYEEIMRQIVEKTASYVKVAAHRRNILIYECEKQIHDKFDKNVSVADIAMAIGASPSYLSRIFKEETGSTIIQSVNRKKVEKAKEYLRDTDMKIYEIADALGFENATYFSHFFKKHTGMSPKDYNK